VSLITNYKDYESDRLYLKTKTNRLEDDNEQLKSSLQSSQDDIKKLNIELSELRTTKYKLASQLQKSEY